MWADRQTDTFQKESNYVQDIAKRVHPSIRLRKTKNFTRFQYFLLIYKEESKTKKKKISKKHNLLQKQNKYGKQKELVFMTVLREKKRDIEKDKCSAKFPKNDFHLVA